MADHDPAMLRHLDASDPRHALISQLCIELESAAYAWLEDRVDPLEATTIILSVGAVLSGTMFGRLVIGGAATDQDTRRPREACAANFTSGIGIGKRAALRVLTERHGGNA